MKSFKLCQTFTSVQLSVSRLDPFQATVLFLYHMKTSENQMVFYVFMGYKKTRGMKWVKLI